MRVEIKASLIVTVRSGPGAGRGARERGMHADGIWDSVLSLAAKTIGLAFWTQ